MTDKKKIVMVAAVFYPEPIVSANLLTQLAIELAKRYEVTVLRPYPTRPKGFKFAKYDYKRFPFKVLEINSFTCAESSLIGRYRETNSMGRICAEYIDKYNRDIDFVFNDCWHLWGLNLVAKSCVRYGIPYITPVQDIYPESLASKLPKIKLLRWMVMKMLGPIDLYTLKNAAKIHTISSKMVEQLSATRNLPKEKFVVVRNWQNEDDFIRYRSEHADWVRGDVFTFMYLGNIGPLAGIELLFEALKRSGLKDVNMVVAGAGSEKESLQRLAKSDYSDCKIEFWDVPVGEVPATQAKADVMCLPVKKNFAMSSIPSKLPAYLFSVKPVLASLDTESDTAMCVRNAKAGCVALPENADDVARCMKEAYNTSIEKRKQMGERGCDFAIQNLSKKENLPILVNACVEVVEKTKSKR